ncbi:unnamed protein product [Blepharisma stoltei]|uniref:GPI mannosyltransferase 1 n=1 Tax=Blepharisma stoltei TaxID=1481888 RepID=A0AAU9J5P3_9CILI|nr:unnamed protein product [Blepharisma stoltei]
MVSKSRISTTSLYILSAVIRFALLIYGEWQDRTMELKYTDIDYKVYSDAANYVYEGNSPYLRHTYRYTPLLAYILIPNVLVPFFGKILFIVGDLVSGCFLIKLLKLENENPLWSATLLLNPIAINVSTRGSSDSLTSVLLLGAIYFLKTNKIELAGILYGLSVHLRIYPIIYCLSFYLWIDKEKSSFFTYKRIKFTLISGGLFLALIAVFWKIYGWEFLYETYLYHFIRKDNRHNFSLYFYMLYLTFQSAAKVLGLLAFIPQWGLIAYLGFFMTKKNLYTTLIAETFIFVIFNKVCTAQYFLWYMILIPLLLPKFNISLKRITVLLTCWVASELFWNYWCYRLEYLGENKFLEIWIASALFFMTNAWILREIIVASPVIPIKMLED